MSAGTSASQEGGTHDGLQAYVKRDEEYRAPVMLNQRISTRRLVQLALTSTAGAFLWRLRVIQVSAFLSAAGLGRWRRTLVASGPAGRSVEWPAVNRPTSRMRPGNSLALVTYHPEYHSFDPQRAINSLEAAARLGVGWVRTDLRWREIQPDGIHTDRKAVAWYRDFLNAASDYGLKNMVVLSTPPRAALRQASADRLNSWSRFVEVVVSELGHKCDGYQLMNEPNNPVYRFFSVQDAAVALVRGASIIHAKKPEARIGINVAMEIWGWRAYLKNILDLSGRSVDIVGLDHYPGTWTVGLHERWSEAIELADAIASATPGSPWYDRHLVIMETGFSTNGPFRDQRRQSEYFERLANVVGHLKRRSAKNTLLLGIYELCDWDSSAWLDPEAHFGLLNSDLTPKRSFASVKHMVASL